MASAISVSGLVKTFGPTRALDGLDLEVRTGEVHGFLGPNGAGKSTTIRVLLGLLRADAGSVSLLGGDPWREAVELHRRLAYVPGDVTLWPNLSGGEVIDLLGRLRGGLDAARRAELLERFELDPAKKGRSYSKGNRQKVALVAALASDVELLILDEPTSGLDPLMESVFQSCVADERARGQDGAALQPHPRRGRGAVRPREHHPRRPHRRHRDADRAAPPHADGDRGGDRAAAVTGLEAIEGVHELHVDGVARALPGRPGRARAGAARAGRGRGDEPRQPAADARGAVPAPLRRGMSALAGLGELTRLALRRDRVILPAWVFFLAAAVVLVAGSYAGLYDTEASRESFARGAEGNPATLALYGPRVRRLARRAWSPGGSAASRRCSSR